MLFDKYELRYLPLFQEELKERALYIADELDNPTAADRLVDDVERAIRNRLETNPEGFEPIPSKREPGVMYYRIYVKNYIVYYAVIEENGHKIMEPRRFVHDRENRDEKI